MAERLLNARFGSDLVDHKTYVIASDGDLMEGISHEAISLAGHYKLKNLIVLWDDNNISIDGDTKLSDSTNTIERFEAAGWKTTLCDGHSAQEVFRALTEAQSSEKPFLIACKTVIGFGFPTRAGTQKAPRTRRARKTSTAPRRRSACRPRRSRWKTALEHGARSAGATGTRAA